MRRALSLLALLLVAGCSGPADRHPAPVEAPAEPAPTYPVTFVVTEETATGAPLPAKVQVIPVLAGGGHGPIQVAGTDTQGAARFTFLQPTIVLVRAIGPDGWTQEGARVEVEDRVIAHGALASERDVFLPLFRSSLTAVAGHTWSNAAGDLRPDGTVDPAEAFVPLTLPEGLQAAYLQRLSHARVTVRWTDSTEGRVATLSAGLAWDGAVWVEGDEASVSPSGQREASWGGDLPAERPADLEWGTLQAALLTRTAIVGDVLFEVETTLEFGGRVPEGMPADDCHLFLC